MDAPARPPTASMPRRTVLFLVIFAVAAVVRIGFAVAFPSIHGGDAAARLANAGTLVLGYQLPLPQAFVTVARFLHPDPLLARIVFCLFGALLAACGAGLLHDLAGPRAGQFGGIILAFDPLLVHYSIVPYQEPVAYGLTLGAGLAIARGRPRTAAALIAAATLCRYEVWLFIPLLLLLTRRPGAAALAVAPVALWITAWGGLAPRGLYVLDIDPSAPRLSRVAFLLNKMIEYETALPLGLALVACVLLFRARVGRALGVIAWTFAAIAVAVTLGHEFPPGSGRVSERLIHLPVILCSLLTALALSRAAEASRRAGAICAVLVLALAARNTRFELNLLRAAAREPDLALARDTARAIERDLRPGECVTVVAPSVDPALLRAYIGKVDASWGDVPTATARAAALSGASPDRDRIAAHLRAPVGTVRAEGDCALRVDVDGPGTDTVPATPRQEITAGPRRARVYRIRD